VFECVEIGVCENHQFKMVSDIPFQYKDSFGIDKFFVDLK